MVLEIGTMRSLALAFSADPELGVMQKGTLRSRVVQTKV